MVCSAFDVARSCYYVHRLRRRRVDARRVALRSQVNQLFSQSRDSAGSRSILGMLREEGVTIGRFRVRRLMRINSTTGYHLRWPKKNSTHCPGWVDHYMLLQALTPFRAYDGVRPGSAGVDCRGVGGSRRGGSRSCLASAGCRSRRFSSAARRAGAWRWGGTGCAGVAAPSR